MKLSQNRKLVSSIGLVVLFALISIYFVSNSNGNKNDSQIETKQKELSITYEEPTLSGLNIEKCKIKETSQERIKFGDLAAGFPMVKRFQTIPKDLKMAVIPIDFVDTPGDSDVEQRATDQMNYASAWYDKVSQGKFKITWMLEKNWVRIPGKSTDISVPYSGAYPETTRFWKKVMPIVDKQVDLTGVQTINFILPTNQNFIEESVQGFSFGQGDLRVANSSRTRLISFTTAGKYFDVPGKAYWSYWAHEFGHQLGIAHVGSSRGESQAMNGMDLMGNQDGPYRELSGWLRFVTGWLEDDQVYCQDPSNLSPNKISLIPLSDTSTGIKLVVIPTSKSTAVLIESRRQTKFSCTGIDLPSGVFVYKLDAKMGNQSYFISAQFPEDRQRYIKCPGNYDMENYPDTLIHKNEKIVVDNFEISVLDSANIDQISIRKTA